MTNFEIQGGLREIVHTLLNNRDHPDNQQQTQQRPQNNDDIFIHFFLERGLFENPLLSVSHDFRVHADIHHDPYYTLCVPDQGRPRDEIVDIESSTFFYKLWFFIQILELRGAVKIA